MAFCVTISGLPGGHEQFRGSFAKNQLQNQISCNLLSQINGSSLVMGQKKRPIVSYIQKMSLQRATSIVKQQTSAQNMNKQTNQKYEKTKQWNASKHAQCPKADSKGIMGKEIKSQSSRNIWNNNSASNKRDELVNSEKTQLNS